MGRKEEVRKIEERERNDLYFRVPRHNRGDDGGIEIKMCPLLTGA